MGFNVFTDLIFGVRNLDKVANGDSARILATTGQAYNALDATAKGSSIFSADAKHAMNAINAAAKTKTVTGYIAKGAQIASKSVNPLLCVAAGVRVLSAKDKKKAAVRETFSMAAMFSFEAIARNVLRSAAFKSILGACRLTACTNIVSALAFVGLSIAGYAIGQKLGKEISGESIDDKIMVAKNSKPATPNFAIAS